MALLNILERQRNSVAGMLSLRGVGHDVAGFDSQQMSWKVLIYDQKGQEILSTLMKVGSLRQHGVTLHMSIDRWGPWPHDTVTATRFRMCRLRTLLNRRRKTYKGWKRTFYIAVAAACRCIVSSM